MERAQACCAACGNMEGCDAWTQDIGGTNCWLKKVFKDSKHRHANLAGSCTTLRDHTDMAGDNVASIKTEGTQQEMDSACCKACSQNADCEGWVQATDGTTGILGKNCWLKRYSHSADDRNMGIVLIPTPPSPRPPAPAPTPPTPVP